MRILIFIAVLLFYINPAIAQSDAFQFSGKSIHTLKQPVELNAVAYPRFLPLSTALFPSKPTKETTYPNLNSFTVSEEYYEHLGIFCKAELRLEQASRIPIKIRLGEVQYVERMEGKYK